MKQICSFEEITW